MSGRPHKPSLLARAARAALLAAACLLAGTAASLAQGAPTLDRLIEQYGALQRAGKYQEAIPVAQQILAIEERSGAGQLAVAAWVSNLGELYRNQGRHAEAEPLLQRALAMREKTLGRDHFEVAQSLNNLAMLYQSAGRYAEAEPLYLRSSAIFERTVGRESPNVAASLNNLAWLYQSQGRYSESEELNRRALAIREHVFGREHPEVAISLNNLGLLYKDQGRYAEAEQLLRRALTIFEKAQGREHPQVAKALNNLALLYVVEGRNADAEPLLKRALAVYEASFGRDHPLVAQSLVNLAFLYRDQHRNAEAEPLLARALAILEAALGPDHPDVATALNNLGFLYRDEGRRPEAERLFARALAIREKALGAEHPDVAQSLNSLALIQQEQGRTGEAAALLQRSLAILEKAIGKDHPTAAATLDQFAGLHAATRNFADALACSRLATAAVLAHAAVENAAAPAPDGAGLVTRRMDYFVHHVANAAAAERSAPAGSPGLGGEVLIMAQWARQSAAAAAVEEMSLRVAAGSDALAALVRERQDLSAAWRERDKALIAAFGRGGERDAAAIAALRTELATIERKLAANTARLEREFPEYTALAGGKPLAAEEVQQLLRPDEVLLFWLTGEAESYVFALTRDRFEWHSLNISEKELADKVARLRAGLDLERLEALPAGAARFDLALAHELYGTLIGPVESLVKDKRHILAVPSGPLASLPLHVLVTETPPAPVLARGDAALSRNVAWLARRQAVSVLPSVASLKALRVFARHASASKPMIAFGDPVFEPTERATTLAQRGTPKTRGAAPQRNLPPLPGGAFLDVRKLAHALVALPETADEIAAVATRLKAPQSDIHLRSEATERAVKRAALADYRVVYFATHGLVAGEVAGLREPALALSIPTEPSELDDGLLTASEVAQLKLNAEWVVLSACNTAAGEKPGAEALSGLARAFFHAGAHALLVSHWAIDSDAAARLTTTTFDVLAKDPTLGRAEALRRAMLALLDDPADADAAYPALWAPFVLVGEGR